MEKLVEGINFKPTNKKPVSDQSVAYDKNFKKTMNRVAPDIRLNEVDGMLSEVEQSLKKKIFSLAKMESLVFADPKLSAVYNSMAENGEEKYGYHYNETIQNMIFNDYVLNSPEYLQKYKMAIPKEKKRRDKSGINQLKKTGEESMKKKNPAFKPEVKKLEPSGLQQAAESVNENDEEVTKVVFLVNETDPNNTDVFAYFPEESYSDKYKTGYAHVGQHTAVDPNYAAESRPATPEEYQELQAELEGIGYNLEVLNGMQETTGAGGGGAGAFVPALGYEKKVQETTTSASSGAYVGPAAWGGGDLMKGKGGKAMNKPIWKGGTIIGEGNYLIDPRGFNKYIQVLNEESDAAFIERKGSNTYGSVSNMSPQNQRIIKNDIKTGKWDSANIQGSIGLNEYWMQDALFDKEIVSSRPREGENRFKLSDGGEYEYMTVKFADGSEDIAVFSYKDDVFYDYNKWTENMNNWRKNKGELQEDESGMLTTPEEVKALGRKLTKADIPKLAGQALYKLAIQLAGQLLPFGWDDLPDINSMWDYIDKNGGMTYEQLKEAVREAVEERIAEDGMSLDDLGLEENNLQEKSKSKSQQRFMGMVHAVQKGELSPDKVGGSVAKAADTMSDKDAEDFASTKHKGLPDHVDETMGQPDIEYLVKGFEIVNAGPHYDPAKAERFRTNLSQMDDAQVQQTTKTLENALRQMGYRPEDVINNIKETELTMIEPNNSSMSNKAQPTGDQGGNVPTGMQDTGGMNESHDKLFEEINNELNAFSIHHNKLKKMTEDKKTPSMTLGDRVRGENPKNFKKDLQHSGTKEIIDVEKELMWQDQQTDVGDDPQKLGQDIEKKVLSVTKGDALQNVGDSANDEGDEVPKRNLSKEEQDEVNLYRLGLGDFVYDNEVGKRFEDRMKADMGDKLYKQRQDKLEFRGKAPMYNKDPQPIEDTTAKKVQFDKEQTGWNERMGLKEGFVAGKYRDYLGKRRIIDFNLNEVWELNTAEPTEFLCEMNLDGLGNTYTQKVNVNENVVKAMSGNKFFTNGVEVFVLKTPAQSLNESEVKAKPVMNEQFEKMKHLSGYKPNSYVDTNKTKTNRGF